MRTCSTTLIAAQKSMTYDPIWQVVLAGGSTYTYDRTRILAITHTEEPFSQKADITLNNSDGEFTTKDFENYKATISYGMNIAGSAEYSDTAPLQVRSQELHSGRGILKCILHCVGIPDQLNEEQATIPEKYTTDTTTTVYGHINNIAAASIAPYSIYPAITISYDTGYDDGLINSVQPKDYFRIDLNDTRLRKIEELLEYTGCQMMAGSSGTLHILRPVIAGTVYAYEYKFNIPGDHTFFDKVIRNRFVNPNEEIVSSNPDDTVQFAGTAISATSFALSPKVHTTHLRVASSAIASSIATAKIERNELNAVRGLISVPMNVGQEVWDWVKVTDSREGNDYREGNVQYLRRNVQIKNSGLVFNMTISFGKVTQQALLTTDMLTNMLSSSGQLDTAGILYLLDEVGDVLENHYNHIQDLENFRDFLILGDNIVLKKLTVTEQLIIPVWS